MIRLYKGIIERLLMYYIYIKYILKVDLEDENLIRASVYNWTREHRSATIDDPNFNLYKSVQTTIAALLRGDEDLTVPNSFDKLFEQLFTILTSTKSQDNDVDLIDTIVNHLQRPLMSNKMDGNYLDSLRKALLLPEEVTNFKAVAEKCGICCFSCKHTFNNEELVTVVKLNDYERVIYCTKCCPPTIGRCSKCDDGHSMLNPRRTSKLLSNLVCSKHNTEKPAQDPGPTLANVLNVPENLFIEENVENFIANFPPLHPPEAPMNDFRIVDERPPAHINNGLNRIFRGDR